MQNTRIQVNSGSLVDGVKKDIDGARYGLITYTADLRDYVGAAAQLSDENGSVEMAVNGAFSGTPENVYIDEPTTGWTNSAISGTWDFGSTTITPQGGTESIDATATGDGDQALLERASSISLSAYSAFSGYIYIASINDSKHDVEIEVRLAGVTIGTSVSLKDYIDVGVIGDWQQFAIPKVDMGLNGSTIDQVVFTTLVTSGVGPNYYLDTINIEETGGAAYTFAPAKGVVFELLTVQYTFLDNITVIEPAKMMSATLANGIRVRTRIGGITRFSALIPDFNAWLGLGVDISSTIYGATDTTLKFTSDIPGTFQRLCGDDGDTYSVVINDDMSGITSFKTLVRGRILLNGA